MNQDQLKDNVKHLIEEIMTLYVSIPKNSMFKSGLAEIIFDMRSNVPLKSILVTINNKIKKTATPNTENKTLRKYEKDFWEHVLNIFMSRFKEAQKIILDFSIAINYIKIMDIGSKHGYPSSALSNFAPHPFIIDGIECSSMEGFLQSLKFKEPEMQKHICKLVGYAAKKAGREKKWYRNQILYWQGKEYKRDSDEYQELLDKAYKALSQNESFKNALRATQNAVLTHSIGKSNKNETVLTRSEFCKRLMTLRQYI